MNDLESAVSSHAHNFESAKSDKVVEEEVSLIKPTQQKRDHAFSKQKTLTQRKPSLTCKERLGEMVQNTVDGLKDGVFHNKFQYVSQTLLERPKVREEMQNDVDEFFKSALGERVKHLQFKQTENMNHKKNKFEFKIKDQKQFKQIQRNVNATEVKSIATKKVVEYEELKEIIHLLKQLDYDDIIINKKYNRGDKDNFKKLENKLLDQQDLENLFLIENLQLVEQQAFESFKSQNPQIKPKIETYFKKPHLIPLKTQLNIDQLMEQRKYRLDKNYIMDTVMVEKKNLQCKVCDNKIISEEDYIQKAWTANKKAYICFNCFPNQSDWKRLQCQKNAKEDEYPLYFSKDNARLFSVLNNNQGAIRYKNSVHRKGSHFNAFQKPWQLELTSKKRIIPQEKSPDKVQLFGNINEEGKIQDFSPQKWHEFLADPNLIMFAPYENIYAKRIVSHTGELHDKEKSASNIMRAMTEGTHYHRATTCHSFSQKKEKRFTKFFQIVYIPNKPDWKHRAFKRISGMKNHDSSDPQAQYFFVDKYTLLNFLNRCNKDMHQFIHPELHYCQETHNVSFGVAKKHKSHTEDQEKQHHHGKNMQDIEDDSVFTDSDEDCEHQHDHQHKSPQTEESEDESSIDKQESSSEINEGFKDKLIKKSKSMKTGPEDHKESESLMIENIKSVHDKNRRKSVANFVQQPKVKLQMHEFAERLLEQKRFFKKSKRPIEPLFESLCIKKVIEPFKDFQSKWFFPCSEVYIQQPSPGLDIDQEEDDIRIYKQRMMLCFRIQQELLEVFEIEICWTQKRPISLELVNKKWVINVDARSVCPYVNNFEGFGGFVIMDAHTDRWIKFMPTKTYDYAFQNNVTFSTFKQYYDDINPKQIHTDEHVNVHHHDRDHSGSSSCSEVTQSDNNSMDQDSESISSDFEQNELGAKEKTKKSESHYKLKILYLEVQLTDPSIQSMDHFGQIHTLHNGIRNMLNMVPGNINARRLQHMNWLQPMEVLGGRCLVQLMIGNKNLRHELQYEVLNKRYVKPLFKKFVKKFQADNKPEKEAKDKRTNWDKKFDQDSLKDLKQLIKPMLCSQYEMCPDLSYRNAIHDCLDSDNPLLTKEYMQGLLKHLSTLEVQSSVTQEIMQGLLPRFLNKNTNLIDFGFFFHANEKIGHSMLVSPISFPNMPMSSNQDLHIEYEIDYDYLYFQRKFYKIVKYVDKQINRRDKTDDQEFQYPVKHFFIDFRHAFFQARLQLFMNYFDFHCINKPKNEDENTNDSEKNNALFGAFRTAHSYHKIYKAFLQKDGFKNRFQICQVVQTINSIYGEDIEAQFFMKLLIKDQFLMSKLYTSFQLFLFISGYLTPFILQLFFQNPQFVFWCNIICLLTLSFFMFLELEQMRQKKFQNYIQEFENFMDFTQVLLYFFYFIVRLHFLSDRVIPYLQVDSSIYELYSNWNLNQLTTQLKWMIVHTILLLMATFKILTFLQSNQYFQKLVHMIPQVMTQISQFIIFMLLFIVLNTLLFRIAGISITQTNPNDEDPDYKGFDIIYATLIQNFRNSIGDIKPPKYYFWTRQIQDGQTSVQWVMVAWAWLLFVYHEVFMLIVLLNFLIAIITETYEKIIARQEITQYQSMCFLNVDSAILYDYIRVLAIKPYFQKVSLAADMPLNQIENPSKVFYVVAQLTEKLDVNNQGFVKSIIQHIDDKIYKLKQDIIKEKTIQQKSIAQQHKELTILMKRHKQDISSKMERLEKQQKQILEREIQLQQEAEINQLTPRKHKKSYMPKQTHQTLMMDQLQPPFVGQGLIKR